MALQPDRMYLRALVPLLLIQLGRDDEAYNFIKFWLKTRFVRFSSIKWQSVNLFLIKIEIQFLILGRSPRYNVTTE